MAIKVGGTTVVDDSRNIANVGTVTATTFSGAGGSLTGVVTSVSGTAPISSSGGATPALSMAAATASTNGYMTSTYASKLDGIAAGATNVTNNNQLANGAGYITSAPAPSAAQGASMVLLQCTCTTSATSIEISGFSSTYDTYMLQASGVTVSFSTASAGFTMRFKVCGSYTTGCATNFNQNISNIGIPCSHAGTGGICACYMPCVIACQASAQHHAGSTYMLYNFNSVCGTKSMIGYAGGINYATNTSIAYYAGNNGAGSPGTVTAICFDSCNMCSCPITGLFLLYGIKQS